MWASSPRANANLVWPLRVVLPQPMSTTLILGPTKEFPHAVTRRSSLRNGFNNILRFSNFGDYHITILHKTQVLGNLQTVPLAPDLKTFFTQRDHTLTTAVLLSEILGEVPPAEEEERVSNGYLSNVSVLAPEFDINQADTHSF